MGLLALLYPLVSGSSCTPANSAEDGGPGAQETGTFLVRAVGLEGTTEEAATVTVEGVADQDGVADQAWQADFALDDGTGPGSLAADTGAETSYQLLVQSRRESDGQILLKRVSLTLSADPGASAPDGGVEDASAAPGESEAVEVGNGFDCAAFSAGRAAGVRPFVPALLAGLALFGLRRRRRESRS